MNPLRFTDPTGHDPCDNGAACGDPSYSPEIQALYDAFQATGPDENYTWEMFYADLLWSTQQAGGTLTTANFAQMPELMETAFNARHGGAAPEGTAPRVFFLAIFRPDDLYAAVAQAENQRVAQLAGVLSGIASGVGVPCSFEANTLVTTKNGEQAIATIQTGDQVLAWHEQTGATDYYTVTATLRHLDPVLINLVINGEHLVTTPEHPFYTAANGWTPAGALQIGDAIRRADGSNGTIQMIAVAERPQVMYNLTVADAHTFFVGDGQWLVHNQCATGKRAKLRQSTKEALDELYDGLPCPYCGNRNADTQHEHIEPWSRTKIQAQTRADEISIYNDLDNSALVCAQCNRSKSDRPMLIWLLETFWSD